MSQLVQIYVNVYLLLKTFREVYIFFCKKPVKLIAISGHRTMDSIS